MPLGSDCTDHPVSSLSKAVAPLLSLAMYKPYRSSFGDTILFQAYSSLKLPHVFCLTVLKHSSVYTHIVRVHRGVPVHECAVFFSAGLLFSSDKLTLEHFARGHMFSMGVSGLTLNSLSQT